MSYSRPTASRAIATLDPPVITQVQGYNPDSTFAIKVTAADGVDTSTIAPVAFNIVIFDNESDFTNINIPSKDTVTFQDSGSDAYIVYVPVPTFACNGDCYAMVKILYSDRSETTYSDQLQMFTPPSAPHIMSSYVVNPTNTDKQVVLILDEFCSAPIDVAVSYTYKYNAAVQYIDLSTGNSQFEVFEDLPYSDVTQVSGTYRLVNVNIDDISATNATLHISVQQQLVYTPTSGDPYDSVSSFSNTIVVRAMPTIPAPTNVRYHYNCDMTTTIDFSYNLVVPDVSMNYFQLIGFTEGSAFDPANPATWESPLAFIPYVAGQSSYTYEWNNMNTEVGLMRGYMVVAVGTILGEPFSRRSIPGGVWSSGTSYVYDLIVDNADAPINLSVVANNLTASFDVSWKPPNSLNGGVALYYEARCDAVTYAGTPAPPSFVKNISLDSVDPSGWYSTTFTGLIAYTGYTVSVRVYTQSADCDRIEGEAVEAVDQYVTTFVQPTNLTATFQCDGTTLLSWTAPGCNQNLSYTTMDVTYQIELYPGVWSASTVGASGVTAPATCGADVSYVYANVPAEDGKNVRYFLEYRNINILTATDLGIAPTFNSYVIGPTDPISIPKVASPPTQYAGRVGDQSITVFWYNPTDLVSAGDPSYYEVQLSIQSTGVVIKTVQVMPYVNDPAHQYSYMFTEEDGLVNDIQYTVTTRLITTTSSAVCQGVLRGDPATVNETPVAAPILYAASIAIDPSTGFSTIFQATAFTNNGVAEFGTNPLLVLNAQIYDISAGTVTNRVLSYSFANNSDPNFVNWETMLPTTGYVYNGIASLVSGATPAQTLTYRIERVENLYQYRFGATYQLRFSPTASTNPAIRIEFTGAILSMSNETGMTTSVSGTFPDFTN